MNAFARIVTVAGLVALFAGCASAASDSTDDPNVGTSQSDVVSGDDAPTDQPTTSGESSVTKVPELTKTKAIWVAPGTENASPGDPSPWRGSSH